MHYSETHRDLRKSHPPLTPPVEGGDIKPSLLAGEGRVRGESSQTLFAAKLNALHYNISRSMAGSFHIPVPLLFGGSVITNESSLLHILRDPCTGSALAING